MTPSPTDTDVARVAAKALMLDPGKGFVLKVDDDAVYTVPHRLEVALEEQYHAGIGIMPSLARPDDIDVCPGPDRLRQKCVVVMRQG